MSTWYTFIIFKYWGSLKFLAHYKIHHNGKVLSSIFVVTFLLPKNTQIFSKWSSTIAMNLEPVGPSEWSMMKSQFGYGKSGLVWIVLSFYRVQLSNRMCTGSFWIALFVYISRTFVPFCFTWWPSKLPMWFVWKISGLAKW